MDQDTPLRIEENVNVLSARLQKLYRSIPDEADRLLLGRLVDLASEVDNTVAAASVLWVGANLEDEDTENEQ